MGKQRNANRRRPAAWRRPGNTSPINRDIRETDEQFWRRTHYKPGQKLNPSDPTDCEMISLWIDLYCRVREARRAKRDRTTRDAKNLQRGAMFWMLREAGASYAQIGEAAGLSRWRVEAICVDYGRQLQRRYDRAVPAIDAPFMARLHAAGALPRRPIGDPCFSPRRAEDPVNPAFYPREPHKNRSRGARKA